MLSVGLQKKSADKSLAWANCRAAQPGCCIRWQALVASFRGQFLETGKNCAPQCEHNDLYTVTPDRCLESAWLQLLRQKRLILRIKVSRFMFSSQWRRSAPWQKWFRRVRIPSIFVIFWHCHLHHAGLNGKPASVCAILSNLFSPNYLIKMPFLSHKGLFFSSDQYNLIIQWRVLWRYSPE